MEKPWFNDDPDTISITVPEGLHGVRLDHFLSHKIPQMSRSQLGASIKSGLIRVNNKPVKAGYRLKADDSITGQLEPEPTPGLPEPQPIEFGVLLEDPSFVVIDKPAGLVVHPGSGNADRTLINGLLHRYGNIGTVGEALRPGIVHRLDKDTSGVMIVARTAKAHSSLAAQFKNRQVDKRYLALVHGSVERDHGRIAAPIGRHPVHRQKMAVRTQSGNYAASRWQQRRRFAVFTLVEVQIETGRTHQIRVHMASIGHPVAGDLLYGSNRNNQMFSRQMLHSWKLSFLHPDTGQNIEVEADLPEDFSSILSELEVA
jgi:23S rRNA pseudouridine1911/1915/1917 synthase